MRLGLISAEIKRVIRKLCEHWYVNQIYNQDEVSKILGGKKLNYQLCPTQCVNAVLPTTRPDEGTESREDRGLIANMNAYIKILNKIPENRTQSHIKKIIHN